jgi:replicative DNA helicase
MTTSNCSYCQRISNALREALNTGKEGTPITLKAQFDGDPALPGTGGNYLFRLVDSLAGYINPATLCETLNESWMRRELLNHYQQQIALLQRGIEYADTTPEPLL